MGIDFKVLFGARSYARRKWIINENDFLFDYQFLPSKNLFEGHEERSSFTYPGLFKILKLENPDVIISNGFSIATSKLWWRSFFKNTPYIIWSGAISAYSFSSIVKIQRKLLCRRAAGFVVYGGLAKQYLQSLGVETDNISIGINTVDTTFFAEETARLRQSMTKQTNRLLYIGELQTRKRVDWLLKAVLELSKLRQDFHLDIVGKGAEEDNLKALSQKLGIEKFVHFHGYKQQAELPKHFAGASCFLFCTAKDIWGLVLIEAMAAGMPCLASIKAGASNDIVFDSENGFVVNFENTDDVVNKINWIFDHPEEAKKIGEKASEYISKYANLQKSANGFIQAIQQSLAAESKQTFEKKFV